MKKLVFVFILISNFLFAQDQIVLRQTAKVIWKELQIKEVTKDSITYSLQQTKNIEITLPIKDIIAYRKGYESDPPFIFPNEGDREIYKIQKGKAINENISANATTGDMKFVSREILLRSHKIMEQYDEDSLIGDNWVMFKKTNSTRHIIKKRKTKIFIVLKNDPDLGFGNRIVLKHYKFTLDSMLFFERSHGYESSFYSIRFSDLRYVGIQTPGTIITKIVIGLAEISTVFGTFSGIHMLVRPLYRRLNVEHKWQIVVLK